MAAETSDGLGACVAEYKMRLTGIVKLVAIMAATLAVAGAMIGVSVTTHDPNLGGRIILFVLGLLFLIPTALGVYGLTRGRKNAIRIHERGIVIHNAGVSVELPFDAVDAYSDGMFLVIDTRKGDSVEAGMGGLPNAKDLLERLREEIVMKRQRPEALKALAAGEVAELGDFALDAKGITIAGSERRLAWDAITSCGATSKDVPFGSKMTRTVHSVFLETNGETIETEIEMLSHRELLIALCNEMKAKRDRLPV